MTTFSDTTDQIVSDGLEALRVEAFGPRGFAEGDLAVFRRLVFRGRDTFGWGKITTTEGSRSYGFEGNRFSHEALEVWLTEVRNRSYVPGVGVWTTAEVQVFPTAPGRLEVFDEEHLQRMSDGDWYPGGEPANAAIWAGQLLRYPRTVDNIPPWMWDIFRAEGVTPPVYNPEFKSVDWKNRRRPVTDRGTDVSVEPTIIDPSKEPGRLAKFTKRLFGG